MNPLDGGFASEYSVLEADGIMANQNVSVVLDWRYILWTEKLDSQKISTGLRRACLILI